MNKNLTVALACALAVGASFTSCKMKKGGHIAVDDDAAKKVYVAPGHYDEFYDFVSGGFSGQALSKSFRSSHRMRRTVMATTRTPSRSL